MYTWLSVSDRLSIDELFPGSKHKQLTVVHISKDLSSLTRERQREKEKNVYFKHVVGGKKTWEGGSDSNSF